MTLSESLGQQALSMSMRASYVSLQLLQKAILGSLKITTKTGKVGLKKLSENQSVKKLKHLSRYDTLEYIELNKEDYKNLKSNFKKYGVQISVVKDPTKKDEVTIFFKSKNLSQVERAMKDYLVNNVDNIQELVEPQELQQLLDDQSLTQVLEPTPEIALSSESLEKIVTINKKLWDDHQPDPTCFSTRIPYEKDSVKFPTEHLQFLSDETLQVRIDPERTYEVISFTEGSTQLKGDELSQKYEIKNKKTLSNKKDRPLKERVDHAKKVAQQKNQLRETKLKNKKKVKNR